ncbi:MAG TPA: prolyl oligopeptidase family serine peptidase [Candidatus Limnocylindrales bacterium]|nr:prolyl oligopeptidase family serine peptidase [Candidatus Limnocylindrales bacterium]
MTEGGAAGRAGEHGADGFGETAPYGSWASPISIELVSGASVGLSEPQVDGDDVYWLEGRAAEGGRRTLLRRGLDGSVRELTPAPFNVRNRVHEYGGASYLVDGGRIWASSFPDGRIVRLDPEGAGEPEPLTPGTPYRYADLRLDPHPAPSRSRLYAVRETHDEDHEHDHRLVANEIVALALDGSDGAGRVLVSGVDFVSSPRPSPDGSRVAWIEWDLPEMPWDSTRLRVADVREDGSLGEARTLAGGPGISVMQPLWDPRGVLHVISDETGWWNLYAFDGPDGIAGPKRNLAPMDAEIGDPAWVFGLSAYGFTSDGAILALARADGRDRFVRIEADGTVTHLESSFTEMEGIRVGGSSVVTVVGGPSTGALLVRVDPATAEVKGVLARSHAFTLDPGVLPVPEPISFPTAGGTTARALYFPPTNAAFRAPDGELPPLIVLSHGGPTSSAYAGLSLDRSFFTSRGIAVVDVDYRGSTGYGRPYRDALRGTWGIADVEDCVAAAQYLVARGSVDPARLAIRGGSAGGYTTLAALTFRPEVFAAGISHFGIADLELIHQDGHKFESRYDEGLLGPWDTEEGRRIFRERSPIHFLDRVAAPMLIFQGLDDRVVPPSQLDAMEEAFGPRGIPYVAMRFEGEGHGFRRSETQRTVAAAELAFLGRVFGFTPADDVPPLEIPGLDEFRVARASTSG